MNDLGPLVGTFAKLEPWRGACAEGSFANYLGVMTDLEFIKRHHPSNTSLISEKNGEAIRLPIVSDGEPFFEFAAVHRAVHAARDRFTMVELGGGNICRGR